MGCEWLWFASLVKRVTYFGVTDPCTSAPTIYRWSPTEPKKEESLAKVQNALITYLTCSVHLSTEPKMEKEGTKSVTCKAWEFCQDHSRSVEVFYKNMDGDKILTRVHFQFDPEVSTVCTDSHTHTHTHTQNARMRTHTHTNTYCMSSHVTHAIRASQTRCHIHNTKTEFCSS